MTSRRRRRPANRPRAVGAHAHPPAATRNARAASGAAAWNRFRGPNGTGLANGAYPEEIGPDEGVLWEREFPDGHSSPVLDALRS